jgi:hypothetical protein
MNPPITFPLIGLWDTFILFPSGYGTAGKNYKAGETAARGWSGAGTSAGFMHHPADPLGATTGQISTAAVAEPVTRIPCLKAGVNSLMTSIIHNE